MKSSEKILPVALSSLASQLLCQVEDCVSINSIHHAIPCTAETSLNGKTPTFASDSNGILRSLYAAVLVRPCSVGGDNRENIGKLFSSTWIPKERRKMRLRTHKRVQQTALN